MSVNYEQEHLAIGGKLSAADQLRETMWSAIEANRDGLVTVKQEATAAVVDLREESASSQELGKMKEKLDGLDKCVASDRASVKTGLWILGVVFAALQVAVTCFFAK